MTPSLQGALTSNRSASQTNLQPTSYDPLTNNNLRESQSPTKRNCSTSLDTPDNLHSLESGFASGTGVGLPLARSST